MFVPRRLRVLTVAVLELNPKREPANFSRSARPVQPDRLSSVPRRNADASTCTRRTAPSVPGSGAHGLAFRGKQSMVFGFRPLAMSVGAPAMPAGRATTAPTGSYWAQSRSAAATLWLILPALAAYEAPRWWMGADAPRAAAEVWLRRGLDLLGFGNPLLLPALLCGVLICAAVWRGEPWKPRPRVGLMAGVECAVWALLLALALSWLSAAAVAQPSPIFSRLQSLGDAPHLFSSAVTTVGAGVYEETLFRWLMLPTLALLFIRLGAPKSIGWLGAVAATSLLFAAAHSQSRYWPLEFQSLYARTVGGAVLAALCRLRGLGIAAGTHLAYDLLVGW